MSMAGSSFRKTVEAEDRRSQSEDHGAPIRVGEITALAFCPF